MNSTTFTVGQCDLRTMLMFDLPEELATDTSLDTLFELPVDVLYEIRINLNAWRDE